MTVTTEDYKNIEQVEDFNASHIFAEDDAALNIAKTFFHVQYLFPWQRLVISNITDSFNSLNSACVENLKGLYHMENYYTSLFHLRVVLFGRLVLQYLK